MIRKLFNVIIILNFLLLTSAAAANQSASNAFIYVDGEHLMLDGEIFFMNGVNYFPRDYGWTSMEDWDWDAVDQELSLAALLHANTIRTGFNYLAFTSNRRGDKPLSMIIQPSEGYLQAVERFLSLADKNGLKVVFWLNEDMLWKLYNPENIEYSQAYLEAVIPYFKNDTRIAAWDLATDLDGTFLLPDMPDKWDAFPWMTRDNMVAYLKSMAETVRSVDQKHLITVGFCWPSSSLLVQDFTDFLFFQFLGADYPSVLTGDGSIGAADEYQQWGDIKAIDSKLESIRSQLISPMPIVPSEYGIFSGEYSSEDLQSAVYRAVLESIFLRQHLAGALNWALTDFTWPPKAYTRVEAGSPQETAFEQTFGIFRPDYSPKPAVDIVTAYYDSESTVELLDQPEMITFQFDKTFQPGEGDERSLAIAFDYVSFIDGSSQELARLDIGDPSSRKYLVEGFFPDEGAWDGEADSFAWTGGEGKTASIEYPLPEGTQFIKLRILNGCRDLEMDVLIEGISIKKLAPKTTWSSYSVRLPDQNDLQVGNSLLAHGKLNLPFSEGYVDIQTSRDSEVWVDVGRVEPEKGRFSMELPLTEAGDLWVRAVWSGTDQYGGSTSQPMQYKVIVNQTLQSSTESEQAVESEDGKNDRVLIYSSVAFALIIAVVVVVIIKRRKG